MRRGTQCKIFRGKDLTGQRFGALVVVTPTDQRTTAQNRIWLVRCDYGKEVQVAASSLREEGKPGRRSCGCIRYVGSNNKSWKGYGGIPGQYWANIRGLAVRRNISFNITIEDAWKTFLEQNEKCALSGITLTFGSLDIPQAIRVKEKTASIDRIDSSKGYVRGNIQWIHKVLNAMKSDLPTEQFLDWCRAVATHNAKDDRCVQVEPNTGRLIGVEEE